MYKFFTLFLALGFTINVLAQDGGLVSGKVTDSGGISLPGATVKLSSSNKYTISNPNGLFEFLNVTPGVYQISVDYLGYHSFKQTIKVVAQQNTSIDLILKEGSMQMSEVVIMGDFLRGQARSLNQQKSNPNISNIISSDQVGRFPDANIGDALKRVPGITMQNDQGEARNMIIRGLSPELNSVTLNGDRIPSAEGDNRNIQMDLIPSDMISSIEVNKTLTPDMDADAIGGSVNLLTKASPNGQRISATLASGYNPIREKPLYSGAFVYGNRFIDNKLGVILSGSYNNNDYGSDNIEAEWVEEDGKEYIGSYEIRKYDVKRVRRNVSGAFDYKINDNHILYGSAMYNWREDWENRFGAATGKISPEFNAADEIIGYTGRLRRHIKGGIGDNRNNNRRLEDQRMQNYSLRGEHLLAPKLDVNWSVNYSTASEEKPNERYLLFEEKEAAVVYNNDSRYPLFTTNFDAADMLLSEITEGDNYTKETELGAKLNFRVPFSVIDDQKGRLRFGARLRIKTKKRDNNFYEYSPLTDFGTLGQVDNSFFGGKNFQPGFQIVPGLFPSANLLGSLDLQNPSLFEKEDVPSEYLADNYNAEENIYATYLRWDQDFSEKLAMIVGARVELTSINYTGNLVEDEDDLAGTRTVKNDYVNVLPSLTFKFAPEENLIMRLAATTALARPNYYALSPFVGTIPGDEVIVAGNPELKATSAYNLDFMVEKYFKSVGVVSGGVFYKRLNNFIYNYVDPSYNLTKFGQDFPDLTNPIPVDGRWNFSQMRNGESVNLYGLEVAAQRQLDFLPGKFLSGFGVYANYTYTKSKAKGISNEDGDFRENISLPGTAPHMINGSLSWENKRFLARVSLNYTAAYLDELGESSFTDVFYDEQLFVDANASYKVTPKVRVFAEANNLTNQPLRYYQGISSRTMQTEYYKSRYTLGLKFDL